MTSVDLTVPATLKWTRGDLPCERAFLRLRDALKAAMHELGKGEFLTAYIATADEVYQGDEIVELFQRGAIAIKRIAWF